jgi:DNA polymerase-3 subunit delta'
MKWYPWLNPLYRQLITQFQSGRTHHAILLQSVDGLGDEALVYGISRWLLCQHPEGSRSCGHCHSCQLMVAGTHPDWHVLLPEKGKSSLGIDPIRQLIDGIYHFAQQGGNKVVWIPHCERLTEAAANALLKTLEEAPQRTYFILGCRDASLLLATLRSRCMHWLLAPPDEHWAVEWMKKQLTLPDSSLLSSLRLCHGAPQGALELLQSPAWALRQTLCQQLAQSLQQGDSLQMLPVLNHEQATDRLHWLCSLLLDAVKWQNVGDPLLANCDQRALIEQLAQRVSTQVLLAQLRAWLGCRHTLQEVTGVNRELLLTRQLLAWEQAIHSLR